MRFADGLRMASNGLWRNKTRTILTMVAIFVAAFTITITTAVSAGVSAYTDRQTAIFGAKEAIIVTSIPAGRDGGDDGPVKYDDQASVANGTQQATISKAELTQIRDLDGIESAEFFSLASPVFIGSEADRFAMRGQALAPGQSMDMIVGKGPDGGSDPSIAITPDYVKALGFETADDAVGEVLDVGVTNPAGEVTTFKATVSGVFNESVITSGRLFYNDALQDDADRIASDGLTAMQADKQRVVVMAKMIDTSLQEIAALKDRLNDIGMQGETIDDQIGVVKQVFAAITIVLTAFGLIALLAASFGVVNTLFMAVQDRTREIGLLKANGLSSGRIFGMFSLEAILLGLWGSAVGVLAAWAAGQGINALAADTFLADFPGFELTAFPPLTITAVVLAVVTIAFLAGALPARRAARLDPIEALRYE